MPNNTNMKNTDLALLAKIFIPNIKEYALKQNDQTTIHAIDNITFKSIGNTNNMLFTNNDTATNTDYNTIITEGLSKEKKVGYNKTTYDFITNTDGTIRWIYPHNSQKPSFLSFYTASTVKAKLFVHSVNFLFRIGLKRLVSSGSFTIFHKSELLINRIEQDLNASSHSIFTGTVGENRKALFQYNKQGASSHFVKYPLNNNSLALIQTEQETLRTLSNGQFKYLQTPSAVESTITPSILIQTSIGQDGKRERSLNNTHAEAIVELSTKTKEIKSVAELVSMKEVESRLEEQKTLSPISLSTEIASLLKQLHHELSSVNTVVTSMAHVDFTPWNMYVKDKQLMVYDWELTNKQYPVLYDMFHFIFQSKVLIGHFNYEDIKEEIERCIKLKEIKKFITSEGIDFIQYYKFYLLINVSYYLNIYMKQDKLHMQGYWLLKAWHLALKDVCNTTVTANSDRTNFIENFLLYMNQQELKYAVLKSTYKDLHQLDEYSDIDLLVKQRDIPQIENFVKEISEAKRLLTWRRTNLTTLEIFFPDHSFLSLDLVCSFKQRYSVYLESEEVLKSSFPLSDGYYRLSLEDDFDYILNFYLLNHSPVPKKYTRYYISLNSEEHTGILNFLKSKYCLEFKSLDEVFANQSDITERLQKHMMKLSTNKGMRKFKNIIDYMKDTASDLIKRKGIVLTFSGVDGAGKTTVINEIENFVGKKLRKKVVVLRHRPSMVPILSALKYGKEGAEKRSVAQLPRQGKNKSVLLSLIRFAYYYLDYTIGQFYINIKYTRRGIIVIYDRYYFDFINDPRRTNLELPRWLTKALYSILLKPKLNFYLYATSDVILKRKKELEAKDINELNTKYLETFKGFEQRYKHSHYYCIENLELNKTLTFIEDAIAKSI